MFTVIYNDDGVFRRNVCTWENKFSAQDKAKQLRRIFTQVKVVSASFAENLPTICEK